MSSLNELYSSLKNSISDAKDIMQLEDVRIAIFGKSSKLQQESMKLGSLPVEERKTFGRQMNEVKQSLEQLFNEKKKSLEEILLNEKLLNQTLDITMPARELKAGTIHPISQALREMFSILSSFGFEIKEGPNIEDTWHNFDALNIPENHPARQMHDTFYMKQPGYLLRTHTSPVQIRTMNGASPPFRIISSGRVYRCDSDMTHTPMFHQVEGLVIDKGITMSHLKYTVSELIKRFFENEDIKIRFRSNFFPFTEPSVEVDINYTRSGDDIILGQGDSWLEVMGCGMVHPNVLKNCKISASEYQGFAFGLGVDRFAMLKYGIGDIRNFFGGDWRWLRSYGFSPFSIGN